MTTPRAKFYPKNELGPLPAQSKAPKGIKSFAVLLRDLTAARPTITDAEIAKHTGFSLRTTQRHIATLKSLGLIKANHIRHLHAAYGWCNERSLVF
jgi:transcription initiation factor IIE alpha subunit